MNLKHALSIPLVAVLAAGLCVPAVSGAAFADDARASPPALAACTSTSTAPTSTDLDAAGWDFAQTRSAGHNVYVAGGLHVYTDDTTTNAKAAGYHDAAFPLADVGSPSLTLADTAGVEPGGTVNPAV